MSGKRKRDQTPVSIEEVYKWPLYIELEKVLREIGELGEKELLKDANMHNIYGRDEINLTINDAPISHKWERHLGSYSNDEERAKVIGKIKNMLRDYPTMRLRCLDMKRERVKIENGDRYFDNITIQIFRTSLDRAE